MIVPNPSFMLIMARLIMTTSPTSATSQPAYAWWAVAAAGVSYGPLKNRLLSTRLS